MARVDLLRAVNVHIPTVWGGREPIASVIGGQPTDWDVPWGSPVSAEFDSLRSNCPILSAPADAK
jgi:hypothetical protein